MSFDELIVSWNAMRPLCGEFLITISVKICEKWSAWFLYAIWGSQGQRGGNVNAGTCSLIIHQDILKLTEGKKATGFRIQVEAKEGSHLGELHSLHACASIIDEVMPKEFETAEYSINLDIPLISQMKLPHPRHRDLCSAASTSAVVSYLMNKQKIDPIFFAMQARDELFDIFGNWVLNTAYASVLLEKKWHSWVQRLSGFGEIYTRLCANLPVVVSVKGPLEGSALPYEKGHLLVVKGYLHKERRVLCMDPAFSDNQATEVSYCLNDFTQAWSKRQCLAYLFEKIKEERN